MYYIRIPNESFGFDCASIPKTSLMVKLSGTVNIIITCDFTLYALSCNCCDYCFMVIRYYGY